MRVSIGSMRERIRIKRLSESRDSVGEAAKTWTNIDPGDGTCAARAEFLKASEAQRYQAITSDFVMAFWIWFRRDIGVTHRIDWEDRIWNILGIEMHEKKLWMRVIVSETATGAPALFAHAACTLELIATSGTGSFS